MTDHHDSRPADALQRTPGTRRPVEPVTGIALAKRVITYIAGEPGKLNADEPSTPDQLVAAGMNADAELLQMALDVVASTEASQVTATHVMTWAELDDLLTCTREVDDIVECLWMAAGDRGGLNANATGAIQTVASLAQTRLLALRQSLDGYIDLVRP